MTFNVWNILIITGIIQGFIFTAVVLFNKKYHSKSTYFLVALIFCYSFGNLIYILPDIGTMPLTTMYGYIYLPMAAIDAPIMYFYVIYFLYPSRKVIWIEKLLFAPFLISLFLTLYFRLQLILGNHTLDPLNTSYRSLILTTEMFSVIYSIALLLIVINKARVYEKQHTTFDRKVIRNDIKWLKTTLIIILIFTFLWAYLTVRNIYIKSGEVIFYSLWLGMAALIYWLGHIGIYKYGIFVERKGIRNYLDSLESYTNGSGNPGNSNSKYNNDYLVALENLLMNEKIYLDSNLTLDNVAGRLKLSPSYLSRIIHSELNTSFPDYLNAYRIKEAEYYLRNPEFSNYTITAIGLEAGFNSKSSFYEVFKKVTGKTPLSYKKEILAE